MPAPDRATLLARWLTLCSRLNLHDATPVFNDLYARYTAPERHYHDIAHIAACLREFDEVRHLARAPDAVEMAIWFHDCVYDGARLDNEEQSARIARHALADIGAGPDLIDTVRRLILATQHIDPPATPDEQLLTDIDLLPLGASAEVFDANGQSIRLEYAHLDDNTYSRARADILKGFLNRPQIYSTETFGKRYERQARANLSRTVAAANH